MGISAGSSDKALGSLFFWFHTIDKTVVFPSQYQIRWTNVTLCLCATLLRRLLPKGSPTRLGFLPEASQKLGFPISSNVCGLWFFYNPIAFINKSLLRPTTRCWGSTTGYSEDLIISHRLFSLDESLLQRPALTGTMANGCANCVMTRNCTFMATRQEPNTQLHIWP